MVSPKPVARRAVSKAGKAAGSPKPVVSRAVKAIKAVVSPKPVARRAVSKAGKAVVSPKPVVNLAVLVAQVVNPVVRAVRAVRAEQVSPKLGECNPLSSHPMRLVVFKALVKTQAVSKSLAPPQVVEQLAAVKLAAKPTVKAVRVSPSKQPLIE